MILPINNQFHLQYSNELFNKLRNLGFRAELDDRDERLSKRIRDAQISKIPYQLIIGDNEVKDSNTITYRCYGSEESFSLSYDEFINLLNQKINNKE